MEYDDKLIESLKCQAQRLRRDVVISMGVGVAGHIGGSNSSADIVAALYFYKMKHKPENPGWRERDRFLLSKGHVGILQYADVQKTPGIEAGTGSLGQGLSIGLGMALGQRLDKIESKTYVLVGDGEIAEGQIWEAAMAASAFRADNLVAIVDRNGLQANGRTKERFDTGDIIAKFLSFGWHVIEIDGHDMRQILDALNQADYVKGMPTVIVANTVKGKGVSFAENVVGYHNGMLTEETYRQALEELAVQDHAAEQDWSGVQRQEAHR